MRPTHIKSCITSLAFMFAAQAAPILAQEAPDADDRPWTLQLGIATYDADGPYGGSSESGILPVVFFQYGRLTIGPDDVSVRLFGDESFRIEAIAAPRYLLNEPSDIVDFADLDREHGLDLGGRVVAGKGPVSLALQYRTDVSSASHGDELDLTAQGWFPLSNRINLMIEAGGAYRDGDLANYLYGIDDAEVREGRSAYELEDAFIPHAATALTYQATERVTIALSFDFEFLPDEVKASPLVQRDVPITSAVALMYGF